MKRLIRGFALLDGSAGVVNPLEGQVVDVPGDRHVVAYGCCHDLHGGQVLEHRAKFDRLEVAARSSGAWVNGVVAVNLLHRLAGLLIDLPAMYRDDTLRVSVQVAPNSGRMSIEPEGGAREVGARSEHAIHIINRQDRTRVVLRVNVRIAIHDEGTQLLARAG